MTKDTLQSRITAAIRHEAQHYGGDTGEDLCVDDEDACMAAHIHHAWSMDGIIGAVYASPERIGIVAAQVVAVYLRDRAVKHWAMGTTMEDSKERHASRALSRVADDILAAEAKSPHDDGCVRGE